MTLPDAILQRRTELPVKPDALTHIGQFITLTPYVADAHLAALYAGSNGSAFTLGARHIPAYDADALIWRYMFSGAFDTLEALDVFMQGQVNAANGRPFTVLDNATQQPIGVINLMNNAPEHLKVELGSIWYSPIAQRTHANLEATTLLLRWAFASGYRRLEWKCDADNARSRQSAQRMGFTFEGIHQAHLIVKGRNRDTAWFRILDHEWAEIAPMLAEKLKTVFPRD